MLYPTLAEMTRLTTELLLADFDAIVDRVIAGEYFHLQDDENRPGCVLMPYDHYVERMPDAAS